MTIVNDFCIVRSASADSAVSTTICGSQFVLFSLKQRIFQKNHPKLTVDEYKVSETDLPSSQKHQLRRENSQDKDQETSHPTTVRQKSILSVLSYTLANVNCSY